MFNRSRVSNKSRVSNTSRGQKWKCFMVPATAVLLSTTVCTTVAVLVFLDLYFVSRAAVWASYRSLRHRAPAYYCVIHCTIGLLAEMIEIVCTYMDSCLFRRNQIVTLNVPYKHAITSRTVFLITLQIWHLWIQRKSSSLHGTVFLPISL